MSNMRRSPPGSQRMPENSTFYDKIVPIMMAALGIVMLVLLLVAAGVLFGVVRWQ